MAIHSPRAGPVDWASIAPMTYTLILLRHGESEWNALNLFTGWVDVNLTAKGEAEAVRGGQMLLEQGILPDVAHTSLQKRAIRTTQIALENCERHWVPVAGLGPEDLDRLLGAVLRASDESFNTILRLGFVTAIRRERAWRESRGESTANLDAFASLGPEPSAD